MNIETIKIAEYKSPVGILMIGSYGDRICMCDWAVNPRHEMITQRLQRHLSTTIEHGTTVAINTAIKQLDEYFTKLRSDFTVSLLPLGTSFQLSVWQALATIPFGETTSYAEIARRIGSPNAVRAVATAIASNAISIFIPCHRVVGTSGSLTGYAGGLAAKRHLLDLESERLSR